MRKVVVLLEKEVYNEKGNIERYERQIYEIKEY